jgi:hypothetical protein
MEQITVVILLLLGQIKVADHLYLCQQNMEFLVEVVVQVVVEQLEGEVEDGEVIQVECLEQMVDHLEMVFQEEQVLL